MLQRCNPYYLGRVFAISIFLLAGCHSYSPDISNYSVHPARVKFGQPSQIEISGVNASDRISIIPGGIKRARLISGDNKVLAVGVSGQWVLVAFDNAQLHLYEFVSSAQAGAVTTQHLEPVARWQMTRELQAIAAHGDDAVLLDSSKKLYHLAFSRAKNSEPKLFFSIDGASSMLSDIRLNSDHITFITAEGKLKTLHVTSDFQVTSQAEYDLPCQPRRHFVNGQSVFLACATQGLIVAHIKSDKIEQTHQFNTGGNVQDIAMHNDIAYVADGLQGLSILSLSSDKSVALLGSNNKLGFVSKIISLNETQAVVFANSKLINIDVSQNDLPLMQNAIQISHPLVDYFSMGDGVLVATENQLEWVNIENASSQTISSIGVNLGGSRRGFIDNDILYVADWFSGLHMYDIRTPRNISHLANFHTPGSSKGVVVHNNMAFIGDDDHGLQIIDVKNPLAPAFVSKLASTGLAYTLKIVGNLVYLADHRGGFHIIDIVDIKNPKLIGSINTPGKAWAVDVSGKYAYVADDATGLLVFDVSNPSAPSLVNQFDPHGYAEDVRIRGNIAYIAFFDQGLYLLDISDPHNLITLSHTPVPGNARGIELLDNFVLLAAWEAGLQIYDTSDVRKPQNIGYVDTDGSAWGVNVHDKFAYVLDWWGGVKVIDVSNPLRSRQIARYHAKDVIMQLKLNGNYAYTIGTAGGLQVFDVSNSMNPIWVTGMDFSASVLDIQIIGNTALVATSNGIEFIDIHDPFYLRWLATEPVVASIKKMYIAGDHLLTHNQDNSLCFYAIKQSTRIEFLNCITDKIERLSIVDNRIITVDTDLKLNRYSLSSQGNINLIDTVSLDFMPEIVSFDAKRVVMYEANKGMHVINFSQQSSQIKQRTFFALEGSLSHITLLDNELFAVLDHTNLVVYSKQEDQTYAFKSLYRGNSPLGMMAKISNHILFAGDRLLSSVELLPEYRVESAILDRKSVILPKDFPLGKYHIRITDSKNKSQTLLNSFEVAVLPGKEPVLSKEKFDEMLKKYLNP